MPGTIEVLHTGLWQEVFWHCVLYLLSCSGNKNLGKYLITVSVRQGDRRMINLNLTILMPCMNEESNIAFCIEQAQSYLKSIRDRSGCTGEILVVDNCSTDRSAEIAKECGARVISEPRPGYGRAFPQKLCWPRVRHSRAGRTRYGKRC